VESVDGNVDYKGNGSFATTLAELAEFLGVYFAVFTLLPLMLGIGTHANWALPWILPFQHTACFLKIVGTLLLAIIIVSQVPVVGEMLLYPVSVAVIAHFTGVMNTILVPNFWLGCGFVLAGVAVQYAVIGIGSLVTVSTPAGVVASRLSKVTGIIFFSILPVITLVARVLLLRLDLTSGVTECPFALPVLTATHPGPGVIECLVR
jgi:hypothetical protein